MRKQKRIETFSKWFQEEYVEHLSPYSVVYGTEGSKFQHEQKAQRILYVCELLISEKLSIDEIRKDVALQFFCSMRTSLDYINYAKMLIEKWLLETT